MTRPPHVTQRTGSKFQFSNCWAAVGSWLHTAATGGTAKVTPEEFRVLAGGGSGKPNATTGARAGTEQDILDGLRTLGVRAATLEVTRKRAEELLAKGRAVYSIATDYDVWPTIGDKDCMTGVPGPDVNHEVGLIPGLDAQQRILVMNPLCDDYQRIKLDRVLDAAEKYAKAQGRNTIRMTRTFRPAEDTEPTDDCAACIADLATARQERDQALDALDASEDRVTALEATLDAIRAALA